jgi:hypothetical protein
MAQYEIGLRPPAAVAQGPGGFGPAHRIICKPEKDLKPLELTADMSPVRVCLLGQCVQSISCRQPHGGGTLCSAAGVFKVCVHPVLYSCIKSNIVSGVTHVLGPGNTVMELMRDEFLLEHSLFSLRLDFFRFKQGKRQSMSDAMNDLQCLGDQSDLGGLHPIDYLTITDDPALLDKLLEAQAPTQQMLKDAKRRFETAERTKKTLSGPAAMAAFTEPGVGANANAVGRGGGRGHGTNTGAKVREPWVCPNLPYTEEQCKKIRAWYNTRELCSKCGKNKKKGKKHACPAGGSTCKKCKRTGHYDPHCFANWKPPKETRNVYGQCFGDADYTSLQVEMPSEFSDSESDALSYATAMSRRN